MTHIDANLLLHACNSESPFQAPPKHWLEAELSSGRPVSFALETSHAFRVSQS